MTIVETNKEEKNISKFVQKRSYVGGYAETLKDDEQLWLLLWYWREKKREMKKKVIARDEGWRKRDEKNKK